MADNILEIRHLSKSFGTHEVLRDIDFDVKKGDVISIIGASGSGKSTESPTSLALSEEKRAIRVFHSPECVRARLVHSSLWQHRGISPCTHRRELYIK